MTNSNLTDFVLWLESLLLTDGFVLFLMGLSLAVGLYNHFHIRLKYRAPLLSKIVIKDIGLIKKKKYLVDGNVVGCPDLLFVSFLRVTIIELKSRNYYTSEDQITCRRSEKERIQALIYGGMASKIFRKKVDVRIQYRNMQRVIDVDINEYNQYLKDYRIKNRQNK
ncbi:hypothetical protein VIBNIFTn2_120215 [Vibrio nigripulchritudo FTn2]|uniref:hypothetical protein n=1 Tax=Vibrio nigripulchritudo TaxID=28173 RepID=UPI0003B17CBC|nr:hypothetical protein [Vibrio nigripulchritudo]CCN40233.1 hypothetical protein VIBNIFTn2_120215 [Vibrio nigripulchritudo FTn2]